MSVGRGDDMNKLLDLVSNSEKHFDLEKVEKAFGYIPFYDDIVKYCKKFNIKMENCGGTHFDWYAEIQQEEVDKYLLLKYTSFIKGEDNGN